MRQIWSIARQLLAAELCCRYCDAAKTCDGLSHEEAHTITFALAQLGVIEIVRKDQQGAKSREATEFRYLLSQSENSAEDDDGFDL
jgi:hypothetical protein